MKLATKIYPGSHTEGASLVQLTSLTKQASFMKRSTKLSLPLQLVFPGSSNNHAFYRANIDIV
jgi:hypothetical protein